MKLQGSKLYVLALAAGMAIAQPTSVSDEDKVAIQALVGQYAQALSGCRGAEFADLFAPETGAFASGFRGRMVGRQRLIELVESERQCTAPAGAAKAKAGAPRPAPTPTLDVTGGKVRGVVSLGTTEYQDEYVKTAQGWRFASRTVVTGPEKTAGLDAPDMLAIQRMASAKVTDYYEPDQNGVKRLMTSGVRITAANNQVTGRVFLKDGSYDDEVYERIAPGQWRVKSSTHAAPAAK
jgi:hypothetical protein